MNLKKKRPAIVEAQMNNLKRKAHERVLARGLVQFRLDADYMQRLLEIADSKGLGYGVLARMWICERLEEEQFALSKPQLAARPDYIRRMIRQEIKEQLKSSSYKRKGDH